MATANRQWLLKVFSGPHQGAEIILLDGQNVIGSGDQCDIVLSDPLIADQHVELIVTGDQTACASVGDAKVYIEGEQVTSSPLKAYEYVTIGSTYFAIGHSDADWPSRPLPEVNDPESTIAGEVEEQAEHSAESIDLKSSPSGTVTPAKQDASKTDDGSQAGRGWVISLIAIQVLLVGGVIVLLSIDWGASTEEELPRVTQGDLEKIVSEIAPDSSVKITQQGDQYFARGYVLSSTKAGNLEDALIAADPGIDTADLDDMEGIVRNASRLLDLRDLNQLVVSASAPGRLMVSGTVKELADWQKAKLELERQTHLPMDDEVVTSRGLSLVKKTVPQPIEPIAPVVDKPVVQAPKPTPPQPVEIDETVEIPLSIHHVTIGRSKFVTTSTGIDLREGSLAPGGYKVKTIENDRVILSKNNEDIVVLFDQQQVK